MTRAPSVALATTALLSAALAHASGAHEHGVSHLDVILDGTVLAIDLRGAGHHLVGFEHAPDSPAQHAAWQATRERLDEAAALFALPPAAACSLRSAEVSPPAFDSRGESGPTRGHHDHDHGHGHRHGHPEAAAEDTHSDHAHGGDWQARYRFECARPEQLGAIEVGLFTVFPAHEEVRYQRFSDGGQGGGTLTPGRTRLPLR